MNTNPPNTLPDIDAFPERVYWLVTQIPEGKVASYGQIAYLAGAYRAARATGTALKQCVQAGHGDIPWHRVINAQGAISFKGDLARAELQRKLLKAEGVIFKSWKCDLESFEWSPDTPFWATKITDQ